jgi:hypothetical protein
MCNRDSDYADYEDWYYGRGAYAGQESGEAQGWRRQREREEDTKQTQKQRSHVMDNRLVYAEAKKQWASGILALETLVTEFKLPSQDDSAMDDYAQLDADDSELMDMLLETLMEMTRMEVTDIKSKDDAHTVACAALQVAANDNKLEWTPLLIALHLQDRANEDKANEEVGG